MRARPFSTEKLAAVSLCLLALLYLLALRAYYVGFFNDDAFYIIAARSLTQGRYAELNAPGAPPLVNYLPGYPLLLAPLLALWPGSFLPLQLLSVALTLGAMAVFWKALEGMDPEARLAALLLSGLSPLTVSLSGTILSDIPYLFLTAVLLYLARSWWRGNNPARWSVLALLCAYAFYLRPSGAAFPLALVGALAWEKRWREAILCAAVAGAALAAWPLRNWLIAGHGLLYASELADPYRGSGMLAGFAHTASRNLAYYVQELFSRALWRWPDAFQNGFFPVLSAAMGLGFALLGARHGKGIGPRVFFLLYLAIYLAVHLLWSKRAGRYLLPVLPLACALAFEGLRWAQTRWKKRGLLRAALVLGMLASLRPVGSILQASMTRANAMNTPPQRVLEWILRDTAPDDVLAAELDGRLHLLTGRPCIRLPHAASAEELASWARARGVRYVVALPTNEVMRTTRGGSRHDPADLPALLAMLSGSPDFERAFTAPDEGSSIFKVKGPGF